MITKYSLFLNEILNPIKEKEDIIYEDNLLSVYIPKEYNATCLRDKNTEWCTANNTIDFENISKNNILFRFLFNKDNFKLRLTWNFKIDKFNWTDSNSHIYTMHDEKGGDPFNIKKLNRKFNANFITLLDKLNFNTNKDLYIFLQEQIKIFNYIIKENNIKESAKKIRYLILRKNIQTL